jgi:hypothetical protein
MASGDVAAGDLAAGAPEIGRGVASEGLRVICRAP